MKAIDLFGVLRPVMGQVKNCPLFQGAAPAAPEMPQVPIAPGEPAPAPPALPSPPIQSDPVLTKGVTLTADVQNEAGETVRGILLYPGADPAYLVAQAFGIRADAPPIAMTPDGLKNYSAPFGMTDKSPAMIETTLASPPQGYGKKVWFWKLDKSPITMEIPADKMKDVDGTLYKGIAWRFQQTGSFYVTPDTVVLKDGDSVSMRFLVKTVPAMGYPVQNYLENDRTAKQIGIRSRQIPFLGVRPVIGRADIRPASK